MNENFEYIYELLHSFTNLSFSALLCTDLSGINRKIKEKVDKITVITLKVYRIGHLVMNGEDYLRYYASYFENKDSNKEIVIFLNDTPEYNYKICNYQLYNMVSRVIPIIDNISIIYGIKLLSLNDSDLWEFNDRTKSAYGYGFILNVDTFNSMPPQLKFNAEEEKKGQELLKQMGINGESSLICFHNRDAAYSITKTKDESSLGAHRNNNLENYYLAIKQLANRGYYCLRMGQAFEKPLDFIHEKVIDYAGKYRSDFGDIYLSAKCKFFLGGSTGLTSVPWIFNVPTIFTNALPSGAVPYSENLLSIYKKVWYIPEKRFLNLRELLNGRIHDWGYHMNWKSKLGIEFIQNSPEEILDVVEEMLCRLDRKWIDTEEDIELQNRYLAFFYGNFRDNSVIYTHLNDFLARKKRQSMPHSFVDTSRVGAMFLRQNKYLLD